MIWSASCTVGTDHEAEAFFQGMDLPLARGAARQQRGAPAGPGGTRGALTPQPRPAIFGTASSVRRSSHSALRNVRPAALLCRRVGQYRPVLPAPAPVDGRR